MIVNLKEELDDVKDYLKDEIEDSGGIKSYMIVIIVTIVSFPFLILYFLVIKPFYKTIRMLIDAPKLGIKTAYKKYFHSDQYEDEQYEKEREEKKALDDLLLPDSRQKKFEDWKEWPDAYVVDKVAVYGAGGRTLIFVDERVTEFDVPEGVENIYHRCFAYCDKMQRISISSTVKRIGKRAFFCCVSLKEIIIPESVTLIDEGIFMNCSSLERIELPAHITEIPKNSFCNCRSLREFILPKNIKIINEEAFRRCYSLEHIDTNDELEQIKKRAFEGCHSLTEFIMPFVME